MSGGLSKQLTAEIAKEYIPSAVESEWYQWWEKSGFFQPTGESEDKKKKFVIVLPPPNVTGVLHLGHALTGAVQDALIRYHRMMGHCTLFLPGTDHAGIATQVVVEKRLKATTGKTRHDLGREKFNEELWKYKNEKEGNIKGQLRRLGMSLDWSREAFTMDEQRGEAVKEAFVSMHERGIVSRSTRLINWCCSLQSAISDLEVEFEDVEKNAKVTVPNYARKVEMGQLTQIAYKLDDDSGEELIIATTRPETLLGDTALAFHPEDERYKKYHNRRVKCPFRNATIPLICDSTLVDMSFGTGVVKITPAHDPNDFECGRRHNLEELTVLDLNGHICMEGPFKGMHRFDCRKEIVAALDQMGLLRGVEAHAYRVGRCSRTKDIVEPMLMPQWFIDCSSMAARAVKAVRTKELHIIPASHEVIWYHWLENIKPWCVSRQLWWGHRIPAYRCSIKDVPVSESDPWVVARNEEEAKNKAQEKFSLSAAQLAQLKLDQDPDVLDTWFSSAMWPYSTMGWPNETPDMKNFFPGALLETGHDILFFWVARMVMTSLFFFDKLPFKEVYLHAMVRDKDGRKMSKSLGNVIDPLDIISGITLDGLHEKVYEGNLDEREVPKAIKYQKEAFKGGIPECGSDALRFGMLSYTQSGKNVNLDIDRVVGYRQFCNKLWNVVKYVLFFSLGPDFVPGSGVKLNDPSKKDTLSTECAWILSRFEVAAEECNLGFSEGTYDFALATTAAYRFWLYELCDVFLEVTKPIMQLPNDDPKKMMTQDVLLYVVEAGLRLLHPMMPFLTEELWHRLPGKKSFATESIMLAAYPTPVGWKSDKVHEDMKVVMDVVHSMRSSKASYQLTNKVRPDVWIVTSGDAMQQLMEGHGAIIQTLAVVGSISTIPKDKEAGTVPQGCGFSVVSQHVGVHMMLKGFIDIAKEKQKLQKSRDMLVKQLDGLKKKMSIKDYAAKVPKDIQAANDEKLISIQTEIERVEGGISRMGEME